MGHVVILVPLRRKRQISEDEKNEEEVYVHAQKDLGVRVLNNAIHHISGSEVKEITKSKYNHIGKDYEIAVTGGYSLTVGQKSPCGNA